MFVTVVVDADANRLVIREGADPLYLGEIRRNPEERWRHHAGLGIGELFKRCRALRHYSTSKVFKF